MPTVKDVLVAKKPVIYSVPPDTSVLAAVRAMNQHRVGAVLVIADGQVVGIFTERDMLRRVVGEERDPGRTMVCDVMTEQVICCDVHSDLDEVGAIMAQERIRHVPVRGEDGAVVGIISIGDINALNADHQKATITYLHEYIYGRV